VGIFWVVSTFFFGCGVGALIQRLVDTRQNTKECTPSASHNKQSDAIKLLDEMFREITVKGKLTYADIDRSGIRKKLLNILQ